MSSVARCWLSCNAIWRARQARLEPSMMTTTGVAFLCLPSELEPATDGGLRSKRRLAKGNPSSNVL